jgi:membrane-bound lytic murein transglycosylase D
MKNSRKLWALMLFVLALTLTPKAKGQEAVQTVAKETAGVSETEEAKVGRYMDQFLERATVAADAANIVLEAEKLRREAQSLLKTGKRDEARKPLRRAGELIAAAAPDGDAKQDDPFLRGYLREITALLISLDGPVLRAPNTPIENDADFAAMLNGSALAQARVTVYLNYWTNAGRARLNIGQQRLAFYRPTMARIFREEGVPEWLLAVGFVESAYNAEALSPKQALGIWQFIPGTGARFGLQRTALKDERRHPEKSTRAAARYLRQLYALFGDWSLALAAYNWGEGRVARVIQKTGIRDFWTMAAMGFMPQETVNYVPSILAAARLLGLLGEPLPVSNSLTAAKKA